MEVICCACTNKVFIHSVYNIDETIEEHIVKRHTSKIDPQSLSYKFKSNQNKIEQNKVRQFLKEKIQKRLGGILT